MKWLNYIIGLSSIFMCLAVSAQQPKKSQTVYTYYLVRHAEKDTGINPALKPAGYMRAGDLYRVLRHKKIGQIYVSQYRRTALTSDSLRIYGKIDTVHYNVDVRGDDLLAKMEEQPVKQRVVLIIGHNNTIPVIIRRLGVKGFEMAEIPDNEYDNLYVVTVKGDKVLLKSLKYGKSSPPAEKPALMKPLQ